MNAEQSPLNAFIVQIAGEAAQIEGARTAAQLPCLLPRILAEPPQTPTPVEADRLLSLDEVAARLGCGKQLVIQRMARGEIIWTQEAGAGDRKVKASRLEEYIKNLPEYRGRKCDALPVAV